MEKLRKPGCPPFDNNMLKMSDEFLVHYIFLLFLSQNFNYKVLKTWFYANYLNVEAFFTAILCFLGQ